MLPDTTMQSPMKSARYGDVILYRRLWIEARPYKWQILLLTLLSLLAAPLTLLVPVPLKLAIDNVLGGQPLPPALAAVLPPGLTSSTNGMLLFVMVLIFAIAILQQLRRLAASVLRAATGENLTLRFRSRIFNHAEKLSLAYHDARGVTDSLYRTQYDGTAVDQVINAGLIPLLGALLTLAAMVYVIWRIDPVLVLVALAITPLLILATQLLRRRLRGQWAETKQLESIAMGVIQEVLSSLRVVNAFGQELREQQRYERSAQRGIRARVHAVTYEGWFGLVLGLIVATGTAAVLAVGAIHVESGIITLGDLVLVMVYLTMLYQPLEAIGTTIATLQAALASAERAYSLLDEPLGVADRPNNKPLVRAAGKVEFREVSFAYDNGVVTLQNISFEARAGLRVGIVGQTGAGKTTLVNLLPRFYDATAGAVLLDDVDLRDYKLVDLRRQFAIVLQEPVLFSTSIAENIAYGRPDASTEEIVEAARAANAHDFIIRLPDGYDTEVGERGMRLSGGERQRISLARAFLRDAPILILDEPTSSVDVDTEMLVMEAMQRLMRGRTTFIIAHRLDTLKDCDQFLVLERGKLVRIEQSHSDLIAEANRLRAEDLSIELD